MFSALGEWSSKNPLPRPAQPLCQSDPCKWNTDDADTEIALSHSAISTTSNLYNHVDSESKKMSAEAIAKALSDMPADTSGKSA